MLDKGVQEEEGELQGVSFASSPTLSSNTTARYFMVLIPSPGSTLISLLPLISVVVPSRGGYPMTVSSTCLRRDGGVVRHSPHLRHSVLYAA